MKTRYKYAMGICAFFLIQSILLYLFERNVNENLDSLVDTVWWVFLFMFRGFEVLPETLGGKIIATFLVVEGFSFIVFISGSIVAYFMETSFSRRWEQRLIKEDITDLRIQVDKLGQSTYVPSMPRMKKEIFKRMGPKTFFYIDRSQVEDLYPQVFQDLEPQRIETRKSEEIRKGVTGGFGLLLRSKFGKNKFKQITEIYEKERMISVMYNRIEQYLFNEDRVTFGLEEFEFDESSIDEFKSMCDLMHTRFDFDIPDSLRVEFASEQMKEFSLQHIKKISNVSGYVAIQAVFTVTRIFSNTCTLSLIHPLNEYLQETDIKVKFRVTCARSCITPLGLSIFQKDKKIKIACLGRIVSWDEKNRTLEIIPVAIY